MKYPQVIVQSKFVDSFLVGVPLFLAPQFIQGAFERISSEAFKEPTAIDARVQIKDGVATVPIVGLIWPASSMIAQMFGLPTAESIGAMVDEVAANEDIHTVNFHIDSGGGAALGMAELAAKIRALGKTKKTIAYVAGVAASGGYYIASAAQKVVADKMAIIGAIGTIITLVDETAADAMAGYKYLTIRSEQSPKKALPETSIDTQNQMQVLANDLGKIFVDDVASGRNVSAEKVLSDFGQGDVMIASKALKAGMIDKIVSVREEVFQTETNTIMSALNLKKEINMGALTNFKTSISDFLNNREAKPEEKEFLSQSKAVIAEAEQTQRELDSANQKLRELRAQVEADKAAKTETARKEFFKGLVDQKLALPAQQSHFEVFAEEILASEEKRNAFTEFMKARGAAYKTESSIDNSGVDAMLENLNIPKDAVISEQSKAQYNAIKARAEVIMKEKGIKIESAIQMAATELIG